MTMCFLFLSNDNVLSVVDYAEHVENTGSNIRNYYKVDGAQSKQGGAKNIRCIICDNFCLGAEQFLRKRRQMLDLVF